MARLMGVLAVQVYFYSIAFPSDRLVTKTIVYVVFALDVVQTCFSTVYVWHILIIGWGDMEHVHDTPWSISTLSPAAGIVALLVQFFFAWRVWVLGAESWTSIPLVSGIIVFAFASCVAAFTYGIALVKAPLASHGLLLGWLTTSIVCDLLITITLVLQLWIKRRKGFRFTNIVVHRALRIAVETGAVTCGVAIIELVLCLTPKSPYVHLLILVSGKIYSNSLLVSLNSRAPFFRKNCPADEEVWEIENPSIAFRRTITATSTELGLPSEG
ncbi:hypothetical protein FPV67DRAFT_1750531 [Lyophyllum atratum]|nr:hypothetical protein FPV67DRAFT_1750531 [Lyophyllum atratum]